MNEALLREFVRQVTAIADRVAATHRDCVETRDRLHRCTELADACCTTNEAFAEEILDILRMMGPYLTVAERQRLAELADNLLCDSVNFLDAMDRHSSFSD